MMCDGGPTSSLAKPLRLRLVAEDGSFVPCSCHQAVVTIHVIPSFQSLNDYLRPKTAASGSGPGSPAAASSMDAIPSAFAAALSGLVDNSSRLSNILAVDPNETPEPEEKETVAVPLPDSIPK
ncbi:Ubiquitin fusion degradation protein 4 [Tilletia horrida]|uniref:Ubiquitin fusion degradation protein 4 n=1 Tax=Tilletia horrida TaxID=155126 RepID=A0AAN6GTV5_9BASI|nr:Ubiquitin fusion degradation protein 4 [Tilletia horrida]KAK0555978.1 Ubiquitin fusion degradation protein 4 [Tilletia horrida]KAK0568866.1 Ubiquitin fusion degradation protein 4 [Tilletia horrida]